RLNVTSTVVPSVSRISSVPLAPDPLSSRSTTASQAAFLAAVELVMLMRCSLSGKDGGVLPARVAHEPAGIGGGGFAGLGDPLVQVRGLQTLDSGGVERAARRDGALGGGAQTRAQALDLVEQGLDGAGAALSPGGVRCGSLPRRLVQRRLVLTACPRQVGDGGVHLGLRRLALPLGRIRRRLVQRLGGVLELMADGGQLLLA